jgi:hypothetical protein
LKPESKFWHEVKNNLKDISFTRLESWASAGVPDLLCYNKNGTFFTVELKVAIKEQKKSVSRGQPELYPGSMVLDLANREPCSPIAETWPMIQKIFDSLITKSR